MGFSREQVEKALLKHGYDEEKALEELLASVWKSWLTSIPSIKDLFWMIVIVRFLMQMGWIDWGLGKVLLPMGQAIKEIGKYHLTKWNCRISCENQSNFNTKWSLLTIALNHCLHTCLTIVIRVIQTLCLRLIQSIDIILSAKPLFKINVAVFAFTVAVVDADAVDE